MPVNTLAYLAPEIPGRSSTFVYREAQALEVAGCRIHYFSVHLPGDPATGEEALARRVQVLYAQGPLLRTLRAGVLVLAALPGRTGARRALPGVRDAVRALGSDLTARTGQPWGRLKLVHQWLVGALLARALRERGVEHLHVHFCHVPGTIGMYAGLFARIPCTLVAHANDVHVRGSLLLQKAERSRSLIAVSEAMRGELMRRGVPGSRIRVLRCGTDTSMNGSTEGSLNGQSGGAARLPWIVGGLGRLVEKKGFDDLLRACARLRSEGLDVRVRLAGEGPQRPQLQALIEELALGKVVHLDGVIAPAKVADWMRRLSCFMLPCRRAGDGDVDGIPVVLMEAMAAGVPVISTRISGIPELVRHQDTGLLVEPGDVPGLARAARSVLEDAPLRLRMVAAARQHVAREFDTQRNAMRLLDLIREAA